MKKAGAFACVAVTITSLVFAFSRGSAIAQSSSGAASARSASAQQIGRYQLHEVEVTTTFIIGTEIDKKNEHEILRLDTATGRVDRLNRAIISIDTKKIENRESWEPVGAGPAAGAVATRSKEHLR